MMPAVLTDSESISLSPPCHHDTSLRHTPKGTLQGRVTECSSEITEPQHWKGFQRSSRLPHFQDDGTKFRRDEVTCPKSPAGSVADCMGLRVLSARPRLALPHGPGRGVLRKDLCTCSGHTLPCFLRQRRAQVWISYITEYP